MIKITLDNYRQFDTASLCCALASQKARTTKNRKFIAALEAEIKSRNGSNRALSLEEWAK